MKAKATKSIEDLRAEVDAATLAFETAKVAVQAKAGDAAGYIVQRTQQLRTLTAIRPHTDHLRRALATEIREVTRRLARATNGMAKVHRTASSCEDRMYRALSALDLALARAAEAAEASEDREIREAAE